MFYKIITFFLALWAIFFFSPVGADDTLVVEPPVLETGTGIEIQNVSDPNTGEVVGEMTTYGSGDNTYTEITITNDEGN